VPATGRPSGRGRTACEPRPYASPTKAPLGLPTSVVVVVELVLLVVGSSVVVVGASVVLVLVVGSAVVVVGAAVVVVGAAVVVVGAPVVVVGAAVVVVDGLVVGVGADVVVVVPPHTKPPPGDPSQASQQLAAEPTQVTPGSASHSAALG
jgi:hypothetical protein